MSTMMETPMEMLSENQHMFGTAWATMHNTREFYACVNIGNGAYLNGIVSRLNVVLSEALNHTNAKVTLDEEGTFIFVPQNDDESNVVDGWRHTEVELLYEGGYHVELSQGEDDLYVVVHNTRCSLYSSDPAVLIGRFMGQGFDVTPMKVATSTKDISLSWINHMIVTDKEVTFRELIRHLMWNGLHLERIIQLFDLSPNYIHEVYLYAMYGHKAHIQRGLSDTPVTINWEGTHKVFPIATR